MNLSWQSRLARLLAVIGIIVGLHPLLVRAASTSVGDYAALVSAISSCANGDAILITNNITVSAEVAISAKGLTIEGNNYSISVPMPGLNDSGVVNSSPSAFRVFNVNASGKTNTLRNLTIKGGNPSGNGGGILNSSGTLVLEGVTIAQSGGSSGSGGGWSIIPARSTFATATSAAMRPTMAAAFSTTVRGRKCSLKAARSAKTGA